MDLHDSSIKTALWRISSHDRTSPSDNTSAFSIDIPSGVESFRNVLAIQLLSASIPSSFYNIDSYNTLQEDVTLELYYNGSSTLLTIPRGQYIIITDRTASPFPANDLLSVIETQFNTVTGSTVTWSFDTVTNKLSLTHSANTLEIVASHLTQVNLWDKLGFLQPQGPATTLIANTIPNISGVQQIFIHVSQLSNNSVDLDTQNGISLIGGVMVTAPFGGNNNYEIKSSMANLIKYPTQRNVDFLDIRLRDSRGRLINVNNQDWSMIIRSYYIID